MCKISVVVPVYYTGKYLEKCLGSVFNQDFESFELLLINDGSCEEDKILCDKLALKDNRVRVFHNENHGLAYSRNFGIDNAKGEYVFFLDSDDYLSQGAFSALYNKAISENYDITMAGFIFETEDGLMRYNAFKEGELCREELKRQMPDLKERNLIDTCVDKLYKISFLKQSGVKMPVGEIFEDTAFNLELLKHKPKIYCLKECFYHYIQHKGSITKRFNNEKFSTLKKRYLLLKEVSKENSEYWDYYYIRCAFSSFCDLYLQKKEITAKKAREYIKAEISTIDYKNCAKNAKAESFLQKITVLIAKSNSLALTVMFSKTLYLLKYKFSNFFVRLRQRKG